MIHPAATLNAIRAGGEAVALKNNKQEPIRTQSFAATMHNEIERENAAPAQRTAATDGILTSHKNVARLISDTPAATAGGTTSSATGSQSQTSGLQALFGSTPTAAGTTAPAITTPATTTLASTATVTTASAGAAPTSGLEALFDNTPSASAPSASNPTMPANTASAGAGSSTSESFDDAYWASQPPAVQQLRSIQDPNERTEVATQLANQGYSIDVPIMVWGWDPQLTTNLRESMGYTWVPSALQNPVAVAPGLTVAGKSYDPNNPPAGSIMV